MASQTMTLKLLVYKPTQKVLFADAKKDFVDFLLHFFSLPLGTVMQILGSEQMAGSLGKLKESIETFDQMYFQPGVDKDTIFNPKTAINGNIGFVKEVVTYVVMDDLVVMPQSTFRHFEYVDSLKLDDLTQLASVTFQVGKDEALKVLKASLSTNEVLTTLFRQRSVA